MNEAEARDLLTTLMSLDGRLRPADEAVGEKRPSAWAAVLRDVDPMWAQEWVRQTYAAGRAHPVNVGDLLGAWREWADALAKAERDVPDDLALLPGVAGDDRAANPRAWEVYARRVFETLAAGGDWEAVPKPAGRPLGMSPEAEARERRCRWWQYCACTHMECRDGWLDEETTITNRHQVTYPAAVKCPRCDDALQVADSRGLLHKPRKAGAR